MANNRRWTQEEDTVILGHVKSYPENLRHAFECASQDLEDRSWSACSYRWYSYISKQEDKANLCFMTISKRKIDRNRKNCKEAIPEPKLSKWKRILNILFE